MSCDYPEEPKGAALAMCKDMRMRFCLLCLLPLPISVALAEPMNIDPGRHLFILSGQSNMRRPLPDTFEKLVAKVFGDDKVIVVTHAHPSQPIRRWYKDWPPPEGHEPDEQENGTLYDALLGKVRKGIEGEPVATVTFVWMQGEADADKGWGAVYEKSFLGILEQFRQDLEREKINFVIGRINDHYLTSRGKKDGDLVRAVQQKLGEEHPNGDWVNTDDLNRGVNPWGVYSLADGHFPPAGYRLLGERFALKACKLIDPGIKTDDGFFEAVFLNSPADIKTHAAIGRPTFSGTPPGTEQGAASDFRGLTDGCYGSADPKDRQWVRCPPRTDSQAWVIDLGAEQVEKTIKGRYIRVSARTAESWLFIDEIAVNPVPGPGALRAGQPE